MSSTLPLTSTLADLSAAKLVAYYPAPAPRFNLNGGGSTDYAVYSTPDYIRDSNRNVYGVLCVDVANTQTAQAYANACDAWEKAGKSVFLPLPPAYVAFDEAGFKLWWSMYVANPGQNAPPLFFVKPAPLPPNPVLLPPAAVTPAPANGFDGPIGSPEPGNPGVYADASLPGQYEDGKEYNGPTGKYQHHVFTTPFTGANPERLWIKLAAAA